MKYDSEALETDIDWLNEYGISRDVAREFIVGLLEKGYKHDVVIGIKIPKRGEYK